MPRKLEGKLLSKKEHKQWEHVYKSTGSAAKATAAVQKSRGRTKRKQ